MAPSRARGGEIAEGCGAVSEPIKCYEITPSLDRHFDSAIVEAGQTWDSALENAVDILDGQFSDGKAWEEISVTVKCIYRTREQLDALEEGGR